MKAINLERENFGFFNVFYVKDNPVMGYDNFGFWGISFGPWAYVPPKPKIPDWCKCEKSRRKHREECEKRCKESIPDTMHICGITCTFVFDRLGLGSIEGYLVCSFIICSPKWAPKDEDFWCPFKCWLEERTLCKEPDLFWGRGHFGYRW